jgi:hypothetical protein
MRKLRSVEERAIKFGVTSLYRQKLTMLNFFNI